MRHKTNLVFLFSLTLLAFGSMTKSANGQEAPGIITQANAPGWITVSWEHTGQDVYYFLIQRQDVPYTDNSIVNLAQSYNRTDSLTDKNLKANTVYNYRVCAVYAYSRTCSDWVSARTLPPPTPSSGGSSGATTPPPARTPLATPQITATRDQDPNYLLLDWSGDPGWQEYGKWGNPPTPTYKHPQLKQVEFYKDFAGMSKSSTPFYDALGSIGQSVNGGGVVSWLSLRLTIRVNTAYTFKVCFTSINNERKCSEEITASSKPVAPTAPADVMVSQDKSRGNPRDLTARIRTFITARWRNPYTTSFIPGQFITLEREDGVQFPLRTLDSAGRVQFNQRRFKTAWVEIKQISAAPNPNDPTEITVDVTPEGQELLTQRGNNYRICAIVPVLGAAGKVCSATVSTIFNVDVVRPVDSKRINKGVLTPKNPSER